MDMSERRQAGKVRFERSLETSRTASRGSNTLIPHECAVHETLHNMDRGFANLMHLLNRESIETDDPAVPADHSGEEPRFDFPLQRNDARASRTG